MPVVNPNTPDPVHLGRHSAYVIGNRPPSRRAGPHWGWKMKYFFPNDESIQRNLGRMPRELVKEAMKNKIEEIQAEFAPNSYEHRYNLLKGLNRYYGPATQHLPPHRILTHPAHVHPFAHDKKGKYIGEEIRRAPVPFNRPDYNHSEAQAIVAKIVPALKKSGWDLRTQVIMEPGTIAFEHIEGCSRIVCPGGGQPDAILYATPGFPLAILEAKAGKNPLEIGEDPLFQLRGWTIGGRHRYSLKLETSGARDSIHKLSQIMGYTASTRIPFFILADQAQAVFIDTTGILDPEIINYHDKSTWIKTDDNPPVKHSFFTPEYLIEKYKKWVEGVEELELLGSPDPIDKPHLSVLFAKDKIPSPGDDLPFYLDGKQVVVLRSLFDPESPESEEYKTALRLGRLLSNGQIFFDNPFKPMLERMREYFEADPYVTESQSLVEDVITPDGVIPAQKQRSARKLISENRPHLTDHFPSPLQRHMYSEQDILVKYVYPALDAKGWSFDLASDKKTSFAQVGKSYKLSKKKGDNIRPDILLFTTDPVFSFLAVIEAKSPYRGKRGSEPYFYNFTDETPTKRRPSPENLLQLGASAVWQVLRDAASLNVPLAYVTDGAGFFEINRLSNPMTMKWIPNSEFPTLQKMKEKIASMAILMSRRATEEEYGFIRKVEPKDFPPHIKAFANNASLLGGAADMFMDPVTFAQGLYRESTSDEASLLMHPSTQNTPYVVSPRMAMEVAWIVNKMLESEKWDAPKAFREYRPLLTWLANFLTDAELLGSSRGRSTNMTRENSAFVRKHADKLVFLSAICRTMEGKRADEKGAVGPLPPYDQSHLKEMRKTINASNAPMFSSPEASWNNLMDFGVKTPGKTRGWFYKGTTGNLTTVTIDKIKRCVDGLKTARIKEKPLPG